jgi:hypothetical protein
VSRKCQVVVYFAKALLLLLSCSEIIHEYKTIILRKMNCILMMVSERKSAVFSLFNTISRRRFGPFRADAGRHIADSASGGLDAAL